MKHFLICVVALLMCGICDLVMAADEPAASQPAAQAQPRREGRAGGGGGGGGGGGRFNRGGGGAGGFGGGPGMMGMMGRRPFDEALAALGDLNLSPDFTLTPEQKTKVQSVRDDFKKAQEKWRTDHADEIKKLDDQIAEIRETNNGQAN